jgi:catechol 2,3-dioxygenase-like lactoylglutathione lyase family enzyme
VTVPLVGGRVFQLAFVVADLDEALEQYTATLGGEPWRLFEISSSDFGSTTYRGWPAEFTCRLALNDASPQLELVQPVSGASAWDEWLRERGEGFHHFGVVVDSVDAVVERMGEAGHEPIQSGRGFGLDGDGAYAYFDMRGQSGWIVEAVEPPRRFLEPDRIQGGAG